VNVRRARTAAHHQVAKQLLRHGRVYREGKKAWTLTHPGVVRRQRLDHPLAQRALEHARAHLDSLDAQLAALDAELEQVARTEPWSDPVRWLCAFRGIGYRTALGLLAEIGDWRRFSHPRELAAYLGLVPSEYSSGDQRHRGHITKTGNQHARRLLIEAAWHYQHPPRRAAPAPIPTSRPRSPPAPAAQIRLHHRHRSLRWVGAGRPAPAVSGRQAAAASWVSRSGCWVMAAQRKPASSRATATVAIVDRLPWLVRHPRRLLCDPDPRP
jgi:transposase